MVAGVNLTLSLLNSPRPFLLESIVVHEDPVLLDLQVPPDLHETFLQVLFRILRQQIHNRSQNLTLHYLLILRDQNNLLYPLCY